MLYKFGDIWLFPTLAKLHKIASLLANTPVPPLTQVEEKDEEHQKNLEALISKAGQLAGISCYFQVDQRAQGYQTKVCPALDNGSQEAGQM